MGWNGQNGQTKQRVNEIKLSFYSTKAADQRKRERTREKRRKKEKERKREKEKREKQERGRR